jgi:hypothetical protein
VDLSSSTLEKFSRHLVLHIPGSMFATNAHVGRFVQKHIIEPVSLLMYGVQDADVDDVLARNLKSLFVKLESGETGLFIDHGVYTRNRNFRLFLSSKLGKSVHLQISDASGCVPTNAKIFQGSLIHASSNPPNDIQEVDEADKEKFFLNTLVSPWPLPEHIRLLFVQSHAVPGFHVGNQLTRGTNSFHQSGKVIENQASPYPLLDHFLLEYIKARVERPKIYLKQVRIFDDCTLNFSLIPFAKDTYLY